MEVDVSLAPSRVKNEVESEELSLDFEWEEGLTVTVPQTLVGGVTNSEEEEEGVVEIWEGIEEGTLASFWIWNSPLVKGIESFKTWEDDKVVTWDGKVWVMLEVDEFQSEEETGSDTIGGTEDPTMDLQAELDERVDDTAGWFRRGGLTIFLGDPEEDLDGIKVVAEEEGALAKCVGPFPGVWEEERLSLVGWEVKFELLLLPWTSSTWW